MRQQGWTRVATIIVVAYALVLQAWLGAFAASADTALADLQAAGILCSEHGGEPGAPDVPGGAHHALQCCILHGTGFAPFAPAPPVAATMPPRVAMAVGTDRRALARIRQRPRGVRPLGARAPPVPV